MADDKSKKEEPKDAARAADPKAAGGGGIKAMLPLIATIVLMPVLAFAMTQFVLVPKLQEAIKASAKAVQPGDGEEEAEHAETEGDHGTTESGGHGKPAGGHGEEGAETTIPKGAKATVQLAKVIVNVKDTQATRYLMSSYTLVGKGQDFVTLIEGNMEQIRDVAATVLSTKNIQDLEKPDIRNIIKSELTSTINTALGKPAVKEIYITDFAIQ